MDLATVLLLHKAGLIVGAICFSYIHLAGTDREGALRLGGAYALLLVSTHVAGLDQLGVLSGQIWTRLSLFAGLMGYGLYWLGLVGLSNRRDLPIRHWATGFVLFPATFLLLGGVQDVLESSSGAALHLWAGALVGAAALTVAEGNKADPLPARFPLAFALGFSALLHFLVLGALTGVIGRHLPAAHVFMLMIITDLVVAFFVLILVKERAERKLTLLAHLDPLTGVHNRRHFFERLPPASRSHDAVILLDIDHFKALNDRFGHAAGDAALRVVAERIRAALRGELFARFGGEEFIIFAAAMGMERAAAMAEELREAMVAAPILVGETSVTVSISVGAAVAPVAGVPTDTLIQLADAALYEAKLSGRNRVCVRAATLTPRPPRQSGSLDEGLRA